ncbi:hypothetical protein BJY52DRAFT_272582 [Lactarius psammicola]|nr:hypothetical protein BJY52DRAFT_272582 [Lactarius psammicola]
MTDEYEEVLDVYCLSILPAVGDWAYARQFLQYETELPAESGEVCAHCRPLCQLLTGPCSQYLTASLTSLHEQYLASLVQKPKADPPSVMRAAVRGMRSRCWHHRCSRRSARTSCMRRSSFSVSCCSRSPCSCASSAANTRLWRRRPAQEPKLVRACEDQGGGGRASALERRAGRAGAIERGVG